MKIYGDPESTCTRKVLLALEEKGATARLVPVDLATGQHKRPAHLALHPYGKLPVLEHEGFVLYESAAIMRYVDAVLPGPSLVPSSALSRARMDQWLSVEACYVAAPCWALRSQLVTAPMFGQRPDPQRVERARREISLALDLLERALAGRSFLVGDAYSLAEVSYLPTLQLLHDTRQADLVEARPSLRAWWLRIQARPSWQAVLAAEPLDMPCAEPRAALRARELTAN